MEFFIPHSTEWLAVELQAARAALAMYERVVAHLGKQAAEAERQAVYYAGMAGSFFAAKRTLENQVHEVGRN